MAKKMTVDGNTAVSHVAYAFSEVAAIYPITPSSPMAEVADDWAAHDRKNLFGQTVRIAEMQSEAGAAGAVHGSLKAGALTTTFTASQGLLLMIPNMYKIAGELLPCVFHVSARALAYHALSIFGDHSDVMACRQTGFAMLASNSVQEAEDMALVAHVATLKSSVPFLHFFDGFRTSHEIQKIDEIAYEDMAKLLPAEKVAEFRARALNPDHPTLGGTAQNPDIYFQGREAGNKYYNAVPAIVEEVMDEVGKITGRPHKLFDYVGAPDAEYVIVAMGSGCDVATEAVNKLNEMGEKVGLVKRSPVSSVLHQAFRGRHPGDLQDASPCSTAPRSPAPWASRSTSTSAPPSPRKAARSRSSAAATAWAPRSSTPTHVKAVFDNLKLDAPKNHFTVGIVDDVTDTSLPTGEIFNAAPAGAISCKFYGLGSDGTVGANKNSIKIIGDHTDMYAQAYFAYDSKKSGGLTVSHLRFGKTPIQSPYQIDAADFTACHNPAYVTQYDMLSTLKDGGTFLLNCQWSDEELDDEPARFHEAAARQEAHQVLRHRRHRSGREGGHGQPHQHHHAGRVLQAGRRHPLRAGRRVHEGVCQEDLRQEGRRRRAEELGRDRYRDLRPARGEGPGRVGECHHRRCCRCRSRATEYYKNFVKPILAQEGDKLPVSAIAADGVVPTGTTKYEKRGIAVKVPAWDVTKCVQCNTVLSGLPACLRSVRTCVPTKVHRSGVLRHQEGAGQAVRRQGVPHAGFSAGLHRLRQLRRCLP